ncbi:MAG: hypothetical protein IKY33_00225 [Clostridia bacterium]|nr:hypothetical protein [Clostridia bacterium]
MFSKTSAAMMAINAIHCILLSLSLKTSTPLSVATGIVATLYVGETTTVSYDFWVLQSS